MLEPELGLSSAKVLIIYLIIPKNPPVTPKIITPNAVIASGFMVWLPDYGLDIENVGNIFCRQRKKQKEK
jgi:hypothetical protein